MDPIALEQKFSCPICLDIPKQIIFQCMNGHIVCEKCSKNLDICPQCRVKYEKPKTRNRALEDMLKVVNSLGTSRQVTPEVLPATSRGKKKNTGNCNRPGAKLNSGSCIDSPKTLKKDERFNFNVHCNWCWKKPIRSPKYVCLCCQKVNCCEECFTNLARGKSSSGNILCTLNHVFALITSNSQNIIYQKLINDHNGAPLLAKPGVSNGIRASSCAICDTCMIEGYICLCTPCCPLFCSNCYKTTSCFTSHKDHIFAISSRSRSLLLVETHISKYVERIHSQQFIDFTLNSVGNYYITVKVRKQFIIDCVVVIIIVSCVLLWLYIAFKPKKL